MALHPDVQARVHAEIDAVVGHERLPAISDRDDMPYLTAVIKETMRWHPVLPLSEFCIFRPLLLTKPMHISQASLDGATKTTFTRVISFRLELLLFLMSGESPMDWFLPLYN